MIVLGIYSYGHDWSTAFLEDGKILFAIEEERLKRIKHFGLYDRNPLEFLPLMGIKKGMEVLNLTWKDIDVVAIGRNPQFKFQLRPLYYDFTYRRRITRFFSKRGIRKIYWIRHHDAHAGAFFLSGFRKAAVLVADGGGDNESTTLYIASKDNGLERIKTIPRSNSLGRMYSAISVWLGLGFMDGPGKTMGLSSYGNPESISANFYEPTDDGYITHYEIIKSLGRPRKTGEDIMKRNYKDVAAKLQKDLEKVLLHLFQKLHDYTSYKNFVFSGGVALNAKANGLIYLQDFVDNFFIFPPAGDAGTSLGAAAYAYWLETGKCCEEFKHVYHGTEYSNEEILAHLKKCKLKFEYYDDIAGVTAELLAKGNIIGWFQGRMEFGPRALGNRSILAAPHINGMKDRINRFIKHREW